MAEVNITSDELHSFLGADVSVTLHGDERDRPSIFGHVQLVTKTHIQLSPATIDGKETDVYQIEIRDIAKCTSMPDDWEQHEHGPKLYIKPATPHKKTHKRTTSISTMTEVMGVEESPAKRQPQRLAPPTPQPQLLAPPRLTRTDSVYPQLQFPQSFRDAVAKHQDELQKIESQQPRPLEKGQGVITDSIAILNRKTLWYEFFPDNHSTERFQASKDRRLPNFYHAVERTLQQHCQMEVDRNIIYSYKFNLNSDMSPQAEADNMWRHFQKFNIRHHNKIVYVTQSPADKTPFISATMQYNEPLPPMKPEYNPKIMFTHAGQLDHMSLRRQYEQTQTRLTYSAWLKSIRIPDLMKKHNVELANPAAFNTIPEGPTRIFFIQEWEMFYAQIQRTFDTWFLDQGWTLQLPRQPYQERNEQVRYQIPNLDDDWPSQADFQPGTEQPKETAKYVTRNEGPLKQDKTGKIQRALKYLQTESTKQPQIVNLFNKWVEDDKDTEFEAYAKACALSAGTKWKTYRATSFTSSQEDSLAKHMENINLSSSTPLTNKEITTFGENNPDTYDKSFGLAGVTYPAAPDDLIHLAGSIQGNYKLEKTVWPALLSISPDDFRPLGRFAHIFIPKYVYVPKEIFTYLNIQLPKGTPAYHLTWQFCYAARQEANKWTEGSEIMKSTSHWTDILLDPKATSNIQFNTIDIIQAEAAQKWKMTMLKQKKTHMCGMTCSSDRLKSFSPEKQYFMEN
jgi:hypothetical protein